MARPRVHSTEPTPDRAYLVAAETPGQLLRARDSLTELAELARTAGAVVVGAATQRLDHPNPATYIGKGKLQQVIEESRALGANVVIFDDELSPSQQRNLERAIGLKVIDRTALILDIFATRARTKEGRLQVELAQMEYLLPRLAGQWSHLERLEGAIGTRGPGETQLETDRRLVRNRIAKIKRDLEEVRRQRALYRRLRQRRGVPVVALVGYTNAGKSTLMSALSGANAHAEDKLFATLDPLTRRLRLPSGEVVLLTDTVGFIQKLPAQLVAAFRATLEELEDADLLLHVVDISHPHAVQHVQTVIATLEGLGLAEKPALLVLNKVDRLLMPDGTATSRWEDVGDALHHRGVAVERAVPVSALHGWNLPTLLRRVEAGLDGDAPAAREAVLAILGAADRSPAAV
jgi:GTP-binding protein HflX